MQQLTFFDSNAEYDNFVDKFKPLRTTDDCYTPENVYDAVAAWVEKEYGAPRETFVRPFWPNADFETAEYPEGCTVVDNPPFSIRAKICDVYLKRGIRFFLFAPALSMISARHICCVAVGVSIIYDNGAEVPTSFVTNLEDVALRTAPDLYRAIDAENRKNYKASHKSVPKYEYPDEVVTAAIAQRWCKYGVEYRLAWEDCAFIRALDAQGEKGKTIYGAGFLLSERAAAERAAAERAAAERAAAERAAATKWTLTDRERRLCEALGKRKEA